MSVQINTKDVFSNQSAKYLSGVSSASVSLFFRMDSIDFINFPYFGRGILSHSPSLSISLMNNLSDGAVLFNIGWNNAPFYKLSSFPVKIGNVYHIATSFNGNIGEVYTYCNKLSVPRVQINPGNTTINTNGTSIFGPVLQQLSFTVDQLAFWDNYILTQQDIQDICDRAVDITSIGTSATDRALWNLISDGSNIFDVNNQNKTWLTTTSPNPLKYLDSLIYKNIFGISKGQISSAGKSIFIFPSYNLDDSYTIINKVNSIPSIAINDEQVNNLDNEWITGNHKCIGYNLPDGIIVKPGDVVTLSVDSNWATTQTGYVDGASGLLVDNNVGMPISHNENKQHKVKIGYNIADLGTAYYTASTMTKNWLYRSGISNATINDKCFPISKNADFIIYGGREPCPTGTYALQWSGSGASMYCSVSPILNAKQLQVFTSGDTTCIYYEINRNQELPGGILYASLRSNSQPPNVKDMLLYGPGDAIYNGDASVFLDPSQSYHASNIALKRLNGVGCIRLMDSILSYGGASSVTEPDQIRGLDELSWNMKVKENRTFGFTKVQPFVSGDNTYIYSSFIGNAYNVILSSGIKANDSTAIINSIDSPILRGLIIDFGNEKARVKSVDGSNITLDRGVLGTIAQDQPSGIVKCNNRFPVKDLNDLGGGWAVAEFVTDTPHNLTTGSIVVLHGSFPDAPGVVGTKIQSYWILGGTANSVFVTGPNTFVTTLTNLNGYNYMATTSDTVTLDPTKNTGSVLIPDNAGFPYDFAGILSSDINSNLYICLPMGCSDALADEIGVRLKKNTTPGRKIYIELSNEVWNTSGPQWRFFSLLSGMYNQRPGFVSGLVWRSRQLVDRIKNIFALDGRQDEIKMVMGCQFGGQSKSILNAAMNIGVNVDIISIAPYIDPDQSPQSMLAFNRSDDEQAIDLSTYDLYYKIQNNYKSRFDADRKNVDSYNAATGNKTEIICYEGAREFVIRNKATQITCDIPSSGDFANFTVKDAISVGFCSGMYLNIGNEWFYATDVNYQTGGIYATRGANSTPISAHASGSYIGNAIYQYRNIDIFYNPYTYYAELDYYQMIEDCGVSDINLYSLSMSNNGSNMWGYYSTGIQEESRGDGSDGKPDNRLCLYTPGTPNSFPYATVESNGSVRAYAVNQWNKNVGIPPITITNFAQFYDMIYPGKYWIFTPHA